MNTSGVIFELVEYELFYPWDVNGDMKVDVMDLIMGFFAQPLEKVYSRNYTAMFGWIGTCAN